MPRLNFVRSSGFALLVCIATHQIAFAQNATQPLDKKYANRPRLGMNLAGVIDWSRELPLVDIFKTSRPWIERGKGKFKYDEHGNPLLEPGQQVETLMVREIDGYYPRGRYVTLYEGNGQLEIRRYDVKQVVAQSPGRIEVDVEPGHGGILATVKGSDPANPIRNIRVFLPGCEKATSPFYPPFMQSLEPFGVLRFMDWQRTNDSPVRSWAKRAKLTDARYSTDAGVPVELMIELANQRKAHPWFCMPHQCDDDFVTQFAALVKQQLDPALKVYVEYSNEVWNYQFQQAKFAREKGKALALSRNEFEAQLRFYSQRSVEIFKLWEKVFGGRNRLVRVLAAQSASPWVSEQVVTWKEAYRHADALGVAPYFGYAFGDPKKAHETVQMSVDKLLVKLTEEVDGPNRDLIRRQALIAQRYKLQLVAYEGGQHLVGHGGAENNNDLTELFIAANRHPRMYEIYQKHLNHWFESGGGLFMVFSDVRKPNKWGSWGVLEYQEQRLAEAHKYRALHDFSQQGSEESK